METLIGCGFSAPTHVFRCSGHLHAFPASRTYHLSWAPRAVNFLRWGQVSEEKRTCILLDITCIKTTRPSRFLLCVGKVVARRPWRSERVTLGDATSGRCILHHAETDAPASSRLRGRRFHEGTLLPPFAPSISRDIMLVLMTPIRMPIRCPPFLGRKTLPFAFALFPTRGEREERERQGPSVRVLSFALFPCLVLSLSLDNRQGKQNSLFCSRRPRRRN